MEFISGIYQIKSKLKPERYYIGSAINIGKRWREHLCGMRKNKHHSIKLQRHFNKYGEGDLVLLCLVKCEKEELIKEEQRCIDTFKPFFNINSTAGSNLGMKASVTTRRKQSSAAKKRIGRFVSDETKKKISLSNKGRKISAERILKIKEVNKGNKYHFGYKHSDETKQKLRKINLGRKTSEATKQKMSKIKKGKAPYRMTDEIKKNMSNAHKGKKLSLSTIEKLRKIRTGQKRTKETRAKMSLAAKGKKKSSLHIQNMKKARLNRRNPRIGVKRSPETVKKISEALTRSWASRKLKKKSNGYN